jgi:hypothetical protein
MTDTVDAAVLPEGIWNDLKHLINDVGGRVDDVRKGILDHSQLAADLRWLKDTINAIAGITTALGKSGGGGLPQSLLKDVSGLGVLFEQLATGSATAFKTGYRTELPLLLDAVQALAAKMQIELPSALFDRLRDALKLLDQLPDSIAAKFEPHWQAMAIPDFRKKITDAVAAWPETQPAAPAAARAVSAPNPNAMFAVSVAATAVAKVAGYALDTFPIEIGVSVGAGVGINLAADVSVISVTGAVAGGIKAIAELIHDVIDAHYQILG